MEEKEFSGTDSLKLIQQMITVAKEDRSEDGDGWLLWGWLLFGASVASVILDILGYTRYCGTVWLLMLGVGLVIYTIAKLTSKKEVFVKTYIHELVSKIEKAFFISLLAMVAGSMAYGQLYQFGYYYILYAFWMFIHGSSIRFKPLIVGAFVNWAAALAIFAIGLSDNRQYHLRYVMIISAVAILVGYLVPGYMLRKEFKSKKKEAR